MKKLILLFCFIFASSQSFSQVLTDNFDYPVGDLAGNGVPPWTAITPTAVDLNVVPGSLTFPNYSLGAGVGNSVSILSISSGEDDTRLLSSPQSADVYSSFLISVVSVTAGDYFYTMNGSPSGNFARVYARTAGAGLFNLGIEKSSGTVTYAATSFSILTTYLVIMKYSFVAGGTNDVMSLFVYATTDVVPPTEPAPLLSISPATADPTNFDRAQLRQGTGGTVLILDGLSVDNSWNNAVLPVELSSFTSTINNRDVTLNWATQTEINNSGFEIERTVNGIWTSAGFVAGNGNSTVSHNYSFTDRNLNIGTYSYRLKQVDYNGAYEYHNLTNEVIIGAPSTYSLSQNYPNPFNPSTVINYQLPKGSDVNITLYDVSGKEVKSLVNENQGAGYYSITLNASSLSSGIYFYTIRTNDFTNTKSMLLVK